MQTFQAVQTHTPTPLHITPQKKAVYCQLRHAAALAGGLEAIATQALDVGEASPAQLDYMADLCSHLTEHLSSLTHAFADLPHGNG